MSWKSLPFPQTKSFPFIESFTNFTQSRFFAYKNFFCTCLSSLSAKTSIFTNQKVFFFRKLYELSSKTAFLCTKSLLFAQTFPCRYPKPLFSTLHLPFAPPLTYCPQRIQLFFCCSLNSLRCKAGASHRFKSLPAIPDEVAASCKTGYLMIAGHFNNNHVSTGDLNRGSQGFAPRAFWLLFARCKKWQLVSFCRKFRGFANLESAHRSYGFVQTN